MSNGPLSGIKVIDFGHTVMGPSASMILADLGADVIKVEPSPGGDPTRALKGFGTGYFGYFNRNKRSVALDLKTEEGLDIARKMIAGADVLIENFGPGTIDRLGLGWETVSALNPRLIFASLKGFFDGPYGDRAALDEIVQMMTGLAFMTGPSGRPLRAGTSVIDIAGGMFAVIAIQAALRERDRTGRGQLVGSALYESAVFLMGQHLCYAAQSDAPIPPMPERVSAWAVYEIFETGDGGQLFVGITSDAHWQRFCHEAGLAELAADEGLARNNQRIAERPRLIPALKAFFATITQPRAAEICAAARIPFAEVRRACCRSNCRTAPAPRCRACRSGWRGWNPSRPTPRPPVRTAGRSLRAMGWMRRRLTIWPPAGSSSRHDRAFPPGGGIVAFARNRSASLGADLSGAGRCAGQHAAAGRDAGPHLNHS
jgi:crotonobetainyl-CoA:carnitine CoA-transferase CaiB-like acyl-CoA transferase